MRIRKHITLVSGIFTATLWILFLQNVNLTPLQDLLLSKSLLQFYAIDIERFCAMIHKVIIYGMTPQLTVKVQLQ